MKKKLLTFLLAVCVVFSILPAGAMAAPEFSDMPNDYSTAALKAAVANGLLKGNDGKIYPRDNLSRAEMAAIMVRSFGAKNMADLSQYDDVSPNAWYYQELCKAAKMGAFQGYNNAMRPKDPISRQEAFLVLSRVFALKSTDLSNLDGFADRDQIAGWAAEGVSAMVESGFVKGTDRGIEPKANITRKDFAVTMDRMVKTYIKDNTAVTELGEGSVMVTGTDAALKDTTVKGNLILGDGIGNGNVTLDHVTVTGRTVIRGGGANSIYVKNGSQLGDVVVSKVDGNVSLKMSENSKVGDISVETSDVTLVGVPAGTKIAAGETSSNVVVNGEAVKPGSSTDVPAPQESNDAQKAAQMIQALPAPEEIRLVHAQDIAAAKAAYDALSADEKAQVGAELEAALQKAVDILAGIDSITIGAFGDFLNDLTGEAPSPDSIDNQVEALLNDYTLFSQNQGGVLVPNTSVLESWNRTVDQDGHAVYTFAIRKDLRYSNGDPILAKDYLVRLLLGFTPASNNLGVGYWNPYYVGSADMQSGSANVVSGLRLVDDYTLTVTLAKEYTNYFYEYMYLALKPMNLSFWLGSGIDIVDEGQGAGFTKDGAPVLLKGADIETAYNAAKTAANGFICAGPYLLKSWEPAESRCTLTLNPNYAGNFEGVKPSIPEINVIIRDHKKWINQLRDGTVDLIPAITEGDDLDSVQGIITRGTPCTIASYDRAGYGKIQFLCDVGPAQFVEVRQAVAHLLDRNAFADNVCAGWGHVSNAPYASAMQMYRDSEEFLRTNLNEYAYSTEQAEALLKAGGWTLNEKGNPWAKGDGLRYKDVTDLNLGRHSDSVIAGGEPEFIPVNTFGCIQVNGRTLMPLEIKWFATEQNYVSEELDTALAQDPALAELGLQITRTTGGFDEMMDVIYRQTEDGKSYGMVNMATGWSSGVYDYSFNWSDDPNYVSIGYNSCYLYDTQPDGLDDLSMRMVYDVAPDDYSGYLDLWQKYIVRWNQLLPEIPLYTDTYGDAVSDCISGYAPSAFWNFNHAILYAELVKPL